jgi:hypothetical protein
MIVYDCEIIRAIPNKKEERVRGIKYCKGWRDFEGMGVACIAVYDYNISSFRIFCKDNLEGFKELVQSTDMIVGYHNWNFDDLLVEAYGIEIPDKKSYDLYKEIYKAHGFTAAGRVGGLKLDDCIKANFPGLAKTEDGAMAPIMWQQGKIGTVIDYCINDVFMTRNLLDLVMRDRFVSPKTGRRLRVRGPT